MVVLTVCMKLEISYVYINNVLHMYMDMTYNVENALTNGLIRFLKKQLFITVAHQTNHSSTQTTIFIATAIISKLEIVPQYYVAYTVN